MVSMNKEIEKIYKDSPVFQKDNGLLSIQNEAIVDKINEIIERLNVPRLY